jgi:hypothetical protein
MFHYVPAIESRAGLETASELDSPQSRVLPEARDWAKDRANEPAPASERNDPGTQESRYCSWFSRWS